ncbi:hypothetical protein [Streptomyces stelliscabiei]|uniref:hypothetical protein n=1 Tax=Streptomyces stelliscabiei TaxID=146820 RepID=UPI000699479A|nr:hypothetical protein [Streptomyces stelliscabiei]
MPVLTAQSAVAAESARAASDTPVASVVVTGNRTGILTTDGIVYVQEGFAEWVQVFQGVSSMALSGDRIGVVQRGTGNAFVQEGDLSAPWAQVSRGVTSMVLSGNRIGVVQRTGDALVKEGGLGANWTLQNQGVTSMVLSGDRIGVVQSGKAFVKEGALDAAWVPQNFD